MLKENKIQTLTGKKLILIIFNMPFLLRRPFQLFILPNDVIIYLY